MSDLNNILMKLPLGKQSNYPTAYTSSLLRGIPRTMGRAVLSAKADPTYGEDIWNIYELSWLNSNGLPQVAIARVIVNTQSENIIESKSFKLYLNSFNQSKFASWSEVHDAIFRDLNACVKGSVILEIYPLEDSKNKLIGDFEGTCIDNQNIVINDYIFCDEILKNSTTDEKTEETLVSHLLKSNCLITNQPDWGSVQIHYKGSRIDKESLLRYLISFRQHNEFHEQCVERIFNDIIRYCKPEILTVYARYTRRGGLDINPWRSTDPFQPSQLRLIRQ